MDGQTQTAFSIVEALQVPHMTKTDDSARLDLARVEAVIRDVITGYALPFEVLSLDTEVTGWRVLVRDISHRVINISLMYATSAVQLRAQLKQRLDTVCFQHLP